MYICIEEKKKKKRKNRIDRKTTYIKTKIAMIFDFLFFFGTLRISQVNEHTFTQRTVWMILIQLVSTTSFIQHIFTENTFVA